MKHAILTKTITMGLCLFQAIMLTSCSESAPTNSGIYLLLDTSGTYTKELSNAQKLVNVMLVKLEPSDSFAVARIDTGSFSEKDINTKVTFNMIDRVKLTGRNVISVMPWMRSLKM